MWHLMKTFSSIYVATITATAAPAAVDRLYELIFICQNMTRNCVTVIRLFAEHKGKVTSFSTPVTSPPPPPVPLPDIFMRQN